MQVPAISNQNAAQNSFLIEKIEIKFLLVLKISLVALPMIALFAGAAAAMYFALPLFAAGGIAMAGGVALGGASLGFAGTALASPFLASEESMFRITDHNASDCLLYVGKALGAGALAGVAGAGAVPAVVGGAVLGGFFCYALMQGAGH